eukprot:1059372-Pelagomonas_calceolata.AAC.6
MQSNTTGGAQQCMDPQFIVTTGLESCGSHGYRAHPAFAHLHNLHTLEPLAMHMGILRCVDSQDTTTTCREGYGSQGY